MIVLIILLIACLGFILGITACLRVTKGIRETQYKIWTQSCTLKNDRIDDLLEKGLNHTDEVYELKSNLDSLQKQYKKLQYQKKSSEVRTGLIVEQMAPFLDGFKYPPKSACFIGRPIDFICFTDEGIRFIEVKSGKSQLSATQRIIRDQIKDGKVTFEVLRISGE